jgi:hypothetical protein
MVEKIAIARGDYHWIRVGTGGARKREEQPGDLPRIPVSSAPDILYAVDRGRLFGFS